MRTKEILEESHDGPNLAWVEPGLKVPSWLEHWDQYAARLDPQTWDKATRPSTR